MSNNNNWPPPGGWSSEQPPPNAQGQQPTNNTPGQPNPVQNQHQQQHWAPQAPPPQQNGGTNQIAPAPMSQGAPNQQGAQPMHTMQPQPDYRLPPMHGAYYQQPPPGYPPPQPAPRQRTAIACRYCRRRKIRCSGFDHSEDGRCTNCQRFSQECVFTPVSAQTQAFVPAHTVWRGQNPPPNAQLYGAYGQPLPQQNRDPYQQQQPPPPPQQQQQPGQYPPPPQGYQQQPVYGQPSNPQDAGRKRGIDEPHTPTLPPPNPGAQSQLPYSATDPQANGNPDRSSIYKDAGVQVEIIGGKP